MGKRRTTAGIEAEAADFGGFLAGIEERLHAEADAEEGDVGANAIEQRFADAEGVERVHHLAEVADAGEKNLGGGLKPGSVVDQAILAVQFGQGVLHAAEVTGAVIENGDHSSPLVDGS